jgi:anthranilate synthase/aminodeoxychorismate synthase-like glutamine amidotransferase
MKIAIIDNYDSFTYNLYQLFAVTAKKGTQIDVFKNDQIEPHYIAKHKYTHIVISPGPKDPMQSGMSCDIIKEYHNKIPILGVCLGHQCIAHVFGAKVIKAANVLHGKTSKIYHHSSGLFKNIESPFTAARYHSLIINKIPKEFQLTAWTKQNEIMGIQHKQYPLFGVQFHPESFMTEFGDKIIKNFINANY